MEYCTVERTGDRALLRMRRGKTNAINLPFVNQLSEALRALKGDADVRGIVLGTASDKFFSIGFDLPELIELPLDEFKGFYRAFNLLCLDLFTMPKPTVAAVTGHATAGGCILALCCDHRVIAEGHRLMGLNEVKLGLPVPYLAHRITQMVVGERLSRDVMEGGGFFNPGDALKMGLVDQVKPQEEVEETALEKAGRFGALPEEGFTIIKRNRTEAIEADYTARRGEKEQIFFECWSLPQTRERLHEAAAKF